MKTLIFSIFAIVAGLTATGCQTTQSTESSGSTTIAWTPDPVHPLGDAPSAPAKGESVHPPKDDPALGFETGALMNPKFIEEVRSQNPQFNGIPFPKDQTLRDQNGRSIQVRVLASDRNGVTVIRKDIDSRLVIPLDLLHDEDRNTFARMNYFFSETEIALLQNKKREAQEILDTIASVNRRISDTPSQARRRGLQRELEILENRFYQIEQLLKRYRP